MGPTRHSNVTTSIIGELYRLAIATGGVESLGELADLVTAIAGPVLGAANATIAVAVPRERAISVYEGPAAVWGTSASRIVLLDERTPLTDSIRDGAPVIVNSADEFASRYPKIAARIEPGDVTGLATYPLVNERQTVGACSFRFSNGGIDDEASRHMVMLLPLLAVAVARIQTRSELDVCTARLQRSNDDLENLATVVAEDFSASVRRIDSHVRLIEQELAEPSPRVGRYLQTVRVQLTHLDELLRDTLTYSRVTGDRLRVEALDLSTLTTEVVRPMDNELAAIGAEVRVSDLPTVEAERASISEVLRKLIDNSLKYRDPSRQARVQILAEHDGFSDREHRQWWKIRVSDNGIGIAPERRAEVFAMFARLAVSDDRPGTGLGLAFVKRVIEGHGGTTGVEAAAGGGTSVWFTLPGLREPDDA